MMIRLANPIVAAACVALLLTGCAAGRSAAGTWSGSGEQPPSLDLASGGHLSGTDGCNRLVGSWSEDGDAVTFSQVASTRMFCADVDTWLSGLHSAKVDGDTLTVLDASGAQIGTLARS